MKKGSLSDLVREDYEEECAVIRDTGKPLPTGIGIAVGMAAVWFVNTLLGSPWKQKDYVLAVLAILLGPFVVRAWQRHKVRQEMEQHRAVRTEMKLNALLGLVNIVDDDLD